MSQAGVGCFGKLPHECFFFLSSIINTNLFHNIYKCDIFYKKIIMLVSESLPMALIKMRGNLLYLQHNNVIFTKKKKK